MSSPKPDDTQRFTVILVPDGTSKVRRIQFPKLLVRRALWVAGALGFLLLAGTVDYVRLRLDAIDVDRLRSETAQQREQLTQFTTEMKELSERLAHLRELERKVRIIANLPGATGDEEDAEAAHPQGRGGGIEEAAQEPPTGSAPAQVEPSHESQDPMASAAQRDGLPEDWPRPDVVSRLRTRAGTFREQAFKRQASFENLVDGLAGKSRRLASTPSIWPTRGWVTSRFGRRISPFTGRPHFHGGLDVAASFGTDVVAPGRGRVSFVGRKGPLGRTVVIDHGWGLRTTYGHLGGVNVRKGQEVERGEVIASVGSSGRSTGPHLHYGVAVNGKAVDPVNYIFE